MQAAVGRRYRGVCSPVIVAKTQEVLWQQSF